MEDKKFPSCGSVAFSSVRSKPQSVNPPPPLKKNKHGCADVASVQRKPRATGTSRSKAASHKKKQPQNILKITTGERTLRWRSVSCANTSRRRVSPITKKKKHRCAKTSCWCFISRDHAAFLQYHIKKNIWVCGLRVGAANGKARHKCVTQLRRVKNK